MIAVLDYKGGNLASVSSALDHLGLEHVVTADPDEVRKAERVIFPGVGAAGACMRNLCSAGLDASLREALDAGKPVLGICVGCQLLLERSEEDGGTPCLGILPGEVVRFQFEDKSVKIPHMGWNSVSWKHAHPVLEGIPDGSMFYFVHSYHLVPSDPSMLLGTTDYGGTVFASAVSRGNLIATQFHPEKSGLPGLKFLQNFARWNP